MLFKSWGLQAAVDRSKRPVHGLAGAFLMLHHPSFGDQKHTNHQVNNHLPGQCRIEPFMWRVDDRLDCEMRKTVMHSHHAGMKRPVMQRRLGVEVQHEHPPIFAVTR